MKRRVFLWTLLASGALAACDKVPQFSALPAGSKVLAFGDSVTYGTGAGDGEDWPTLLAASTGWNIVNAGIPGDTTEAGRQRFGDLLDSEQPALVIIEIGGNDFLRRRSAGAVKEDIRGMIRQARGRGSQVVLVAVPEFSLLAVVAGKPDDAPLYRELGEEEGVPVIEKVFSGILSNPAWCADKIHPNAEGYRQMAAGIGQSLREFGLRS